MGGIRKGVIAQRPMAGVGTCRAARALARDMLSRYLCSSVWSVEQSRVRSHVSGRMRPLLLSVVQPVACRPDGTNSYLYAVGRGEGDDNIAPAKQYSNTQITRTRDNSEETRKQSVRAKMCRNQSTPQQTPPVRLARGPPAKTPIDFHIVRLVSGSFGIESPDGGSVAERGAGKLSSASPDTRSECAGSPWRQRV